MFHKDEADFLGGESSNGVQLLGDVVILINHGDGLVTGEVHHVVGLRNSSSSLYRCYPLNNNLSQLSK